MSRDPVERTSNGHHVPPPAVPTPIDWRLLARFYVALQLGAGLLLAAAFAVLAALRPLFGAGDAPFLRSWLTTFVLLPVTFVPALALWNRWVVARVGRRSSWFRVIVEVAFAIEFLACVVVHRIA
jgi:hypothetical protein